MPVTLPKEWRSSDRQLLTCPARWYLANAYPYNTLTPIWFIRGNAIHAAIESIIAEGLTLDEGLELGATILTDGIGEGVDLWSKTDPDPETAIYNTATCIRTWWQQVHPVSEERADIYKTLDWPPRVEVKLTAFGAMTRIDAVFRLTGEPRTVVLVDWKTGASKSDDTQLWIYQRLIEEQHQVKVHAAWFHNILQGKIQQANPYPGDDIIHSTLGAMLALRGAGHYPPLHGWYCQYCEAQDMCPIQPGDSDLRVDTLSPTEVRWVSVTSPEGMSRWR